MTDSMARLTRTLAEDITPYDANPPLANRLDPLDELFFITLTTMTQYGAVDVFDDLKNAFTTWDGLLRRGAEANVRDVIQRCGLVNQKAPQIVAVAKRLKHDFGAVTLDSLHDMDDEEAEEYLLSLPRVGKKVARCVMMYSLRRAVLPVDAHVLRVGKRVGLLDEGLSWTKAHDAVHERVPDELRYQLHVGLVRHGREVCTHKNPKCDECVLRSEQLCPGLPPTSPAPTI
jgi:endonuclease III